MPHPAEAFLAAPDSTSSSIADSLVIESASALQATADTLALHAQLGASFDATNETYYQDAFIDTTFLGRQRVGTPETRSAAVFAARMAGTRDQRSAQYRAQTEISLGDRLEREFGTAFWRHLGDDWTWTLEPALEHRRDRTFDRDLDEWRGTFGSRARRALTDESTTGELGARAEFLRSTGTGSEFQPDRNGALLSAAAEHLGLLGDEWRLGYRVAVRSFPDSSERDHLEHQWEAHWKSAAAGPSLAVDFTATRRVTQHEAPTSRDRFWIGEAALESRIESGSSWSVRARAEGEATRYDLEDSTLYFDYQVARGQLALRDEPSVRWAFELGPKIEWLTAALDPGESYREAGGELNLEFLGLGSWWILSPAAGWRDYGDVSSAGPGTPSLHSSYAFYSLDVVADQALPLGLRFKAIAALRWEDHVDPTQNARSVYASVEVLRGLR